MRNVISTLLIISLFLPISLLAQNVGRQGDSIKNYVDINGLKQGPWLKKDKDGNKVFEGTFKNGVPIGLFKKYHPNDSVKAEMYFDKADQKKVSVKLYDETGELSAEGSYYNKKKVGLWKFYGHNAKLVAEENYKNGIKHGESKTYFASGKVQQIKWFANGEPHGEWKWFYESGKPRMISAHKNGNRTGEFKIFFESGAVYIKGGYENDRKEGVWIIYQENGTVTKSFKFTAGVAANQAEIDRQVTEELNKMELNRGKFKEPGMR